MMKIGHLREDGYEGVYFADEDGNTLGIERADEWDAHDVAEGMDTYCIVLGTGQSVYGGVESWEVVSPGLALLVLTEEAAQVLGTNFDAFEIEADPRELAAVDPIVRQLIRE